MIVLPSNLKPVDRVAFSGDGRLLAVGGGKRKPVDVWDLADVSRPPIRLPLRLDPPLFVFRPNGVLLVADSTTVAGFEPQTGRELWRVEPARAFVIEGFDTSADGRRMAVGFLHQLTSSDGYQLWHFEPNGLLVRGWSQRAAHRCYCRAACFLGGGDLLAVAEERCEVEAEAARVARVRILDAATGAALHTLPCPQDRIFGLAASPTAQQVAVCCGTSLLVWEGPDWGRPARKISNDTRSQFSGIAFHPSGRYLGAASTDATVKLYDTGSWQRVAGFNWDIGKLRSIAFSPDGSLAAAGSDTGKVVVWDVDV